jgi:hypothetical protein
MLRRLLTVAALTAFTSAAVAQTDHSHMHHQMDDEDGAPSMPAMTGALGSYALTREASGTAWQPDNSQHAGVHTTAGDWMLMGHAVLNGVYDWQSGPRGDDKAFESGMIMGSARRSFDNGDTLNFRIMMSPDPIMGRKGYPLLLASGETADGVSALVDRQHPHDLVMELSGSYSHALSNKSSVFIYAGLPGEPAFGPPAFMHRASIMDSPEAPIAHHWLDSTHITFGVVTAGAVYDTWKVEASRFTGREPDEYRYDIDHPRFDSTSARLSWNPLASLSLQASWAHFKSPEQLEPLEKETRWSASAIYTVPIWDGGLWSSTFAWGRKDLSGGGPSLDAFVLESAVKPVPLWTVFARAERIESAELDLASVGHSHVDTVSKLSFGVVKDFRVHEHALIGIGGLYALNRVSANLGPSYGGRNPDGAMAFVRLKIE